MATMTATKTLIAEANDLERAEISYLLEKLENSYSEGNPMISDEELQEECNIVRYGNKYGKPNRNWTEDLKKVEEIKTRICLK